MTIRMGCKHCGVLKEFRDVDDIFQHIIEILGEQLTLPEYRDAMQKLEELACTEAQEASDRKEVVKGW